MITNHFKIRGYQILVQTPHKAPFWATADGVAQFLYKDYMISMSTSGLSQGACMTYVCVFKPGNDYQNVAHDGFRSVQDAIQWIDLNVCSDDVYNNIINPLRQTTTTYAESFRKFLINAEIDSVKFNSCIDIFFQSHNFGDKANLMDILSNPDMNLYNFTIAMAIFNCKD